MPVTLPISRLISVDVNYSQTLAQSQNLSNLLLLGTSTVIDTVQRMRIYNSLGAVATDFGTSAEEYLASVLWFEQNPQPTQINIGRWVNAASHGQLIGGALTAAQQVISLWTIITAGSFVVSVDSTPQTVTGVSFASATTLNGVASAINGVLTGATVAWNSTYNNFTITSATTGTTSLISFLTAAGSGTDISNMLVGRNTAGNGAYVAPGLAAETALAATTLFDNNFGQTWYSLVIPAAVDADHLAIAPYIEGSSNAHYYGLTSAESGILSSVSTTDIFYELAQLKYNKTGGFYCSSNIAGVVSALARIQTTNYNENNSTITLMYKTEPGITPETLNSTQIGALEGKDGNVYVNYNNNTAIIEPGVSFSGQYIDTVMGIDWLATSIQTAIYNLLYGSQTKIPQTDAGVHQVIVTAEQVLQQGVVNGLIAPGTWNQGGFGTLNQGDFLAAGYYVYAPTVESQSELTRSGRICPPLQIAVKLAGAIQYVNVQININN
jgi:hypothetical protein